MQVCPNCGEENPDRFRLCGICGTKLAPDDVVQEVRKTVTVVFCDLKGSTTLGETLDTESLRQILTVYFNEMRAVLERHGGTVEKYIGDAIMAVFGLPKLHEDDALRAVRAAFEMKQTLERVNGQLETTWGVRLANRTGVNTGDVVAGDVAAGQRLVTGDTVNTAARLEQNAPTLEILLGEPTYRLVKDAVEAEPVEPLELKGKAEPVPAYRLVSVTRGEGVARRLDSPMVGRRSELQVLMDALDRAETGSIGQLVTVLGTAGVGKSRLLREFLATAGGRVVSFHGRCLSYGDGITFWPLAEIVRSAAGIEDDDPLAVADSKLRSLMGGEGSDVVDRLAGAIGLSEATFPTQETFWAARRLFERLAAVRPAVILIEDIHWAEETFLELIRYVVDAAGAAIALVCSSRPDLLETHPDWAEELTNATSVVLDPLSAEESSTVVENLLGGAEFDTAVRDKIVAAAEGNPLFVEQMLSMLVEEGAVVRDDRGRWILLSDAGTITIPPSISALLSARLDRLGPTDRIVIERGAVIGQVFYRRAVEDLSPERVRPHVGESLQSLVQKQFAQRHDPVFAGQEGYRFAHILIRDAAYNGLLKRVRAELHERFVDWLESVATDRIKEFEEIRGYHLEQAYLTRVQLAPLDERTRQLGRRGSAYLSSAGRRALARGDPPAAANLLQRAATLLPTDGPDRPPLLIEAAEALMELGSFSTADAVLSEAIELAAALGQRGTEEAARVVRLEVNYVREGTDSENRLVAEVERAIQTLEDLGDHAGLFRAWRLLVQIHWTGFRWREAANAARQKMRHAGLAGDRSAEARALPDLAVTAEYGPTPTSDAIAECRSILEKVNDRKAEATTLLIWSRLEAMRGNFDEARELYRRSRATLEELGWNFLAALTSMDSGAVEMLAGDPVAAERELRGDYEALHRMGEKNYVSTTAALLADALYQQRRFDEAEALAAESERLAARDDVVTQVLWRSVRAKVRAQQRRAEEAQALGREAVDLLRRSEAPEWQGNALMDLAEILRLSGNEAEAAMAAEEAAVLFERKGSIVSLQRARGFLTAVHA